MPLSTPFINTLPAFDATKGLSTSINVLGGGAISGYQFSLYLNDGSDNPFYTSQIFQVTNDVESIDIRTFPIQIPANATSSGVTLTNNNTYRITATIYDQEGNSVSSSQYSIFNCYKEPTIKMQYNVILNNVSTYIDLTNGATLPSATPSFKLIFNNMDLQSVARPNILTIDVYGINQGTKNLIASDLKFYTFDEEIISSGENIGAQYTTKFDLSGFEINVDAYGNPVDSLYSSYEIDYKVETIENMVIKNDVIELMCYYKTISNSPYLTVTNMCNEGVVRISCFGLESFNGISNPEDVVYIDDEEADFREDGTWAMWDRLFSLNQPYTLNIWCRALNPNTIIATLTSSIYTDRYIELKYNVKTYDSIEYAFISLQTGRNDVNGNHIGIYYIESDYIQKSSINNNTKLFIGIQQQGSLFDIKFQTI